METSDFFDIEFLLVRIRTSASGLRMAQIEHSSAMNKK